MCDLDELREKKGEREECCVYVVLRRNMRIILCGRSLYMR